MPRWPRHEIEEGRRIVAGRLPALLHSRVQLGMILARGDRGPDDCWPWPWTRAHNGYGLITMDAHQFVVTRIVLGIEWRHDDVQAGHLCDNPPCVNPAHLQPMTSAQNQADKGAKGRAARGTLNGGGGKLNEDNVREIRRRLLGSETLTEIARSYAITRVMVARIRDGKAWAWLS